MRSFSFPKALNVTSSLYLGVVAEPMALLPTGDVGHASSFDYKRPLKS